MSNQHSTPDPKLYALVSKQGTAMSEAVLTEDEFTVQNKLQTMAEAPKDWDGGDFHDVSDNDALRAALDDADDAEEQP
ncbi:hypothetical protein [Arthrobacter sp. ES1]|uniref:hypothetical protein n=1 Tax=Arthrobacter sp. ES1 TaxID=1897056 RepID=UPI001CFFB37E|nr:hypothetical protein [Arthrobacter sp. ES1]MCB5280561.1 hypothetical protein [Arthrobacter sp. ES1]